MRYKPFGNTGLNVSALSVGTWAIGGANYGKVDRDTSIAAIRTMIDQGVNLIDTAPVYNAGNAERVVGEAIEGIRDKVILCTKTALFNDPAQDGKPVKDGRYETIMRLYEESCRNLKTDYIDIYLLHWPVFNVPVEECMRAMMDLKNAGKIGHIGVSNYSIAQIEEAQLYGDVEVIQPPYSMVDRSQEDISKWCAQRGIAVMSYASLGAGILSGKYRQLPDFEKTDLRLTFYDYFREPKFSKIMKLLEVMDNVSAAHNNAKLSQVALNWSTQKDFIHTAVIGVSSPNHAVENCGGTDWMLTDEEMRMLDDAITLMEQNI